MTKHKFKSEEIIYSGGGCWGFRSNRSVLHTYCGLNTADFDIATKYHWDGVSCKLCLKHKPVRQKK